MDRNDYKLYIPDDYKYDDEERNDFMQGFDTGTAFDTEIREAEKKGWVERVERD